MKRFLLSMAAAMVIGSPVAMAEVKIDVEGYKQKIAKSDADILDAKKNIKSAVWIERGKLFGELYGLPSAGLFIGQDPTTLGLLFGKVEDTKVIINTKAFAKKEFANVAVYMENDKVVSWVPTLELSQGALQSSYNAFDKAFQVDPKSEPKIKPLLISLSDVAKQQAANYYFINESVLSAQNFELAYEAQIHPAVNKLDTSAVFNAGYLYALSREYEKSLKYLTIAKDNGYYNDGDIYQLMYYGYFGLKDIPQAKSILLEGLAKFPKNNKIVEALLSVYMEGGGDPRDIIPLVEKAIASDPKNPDLYSGLGRVYDKLGDFDKSIESFKKSAELAPNDYSNNFNLGLLYIRKGEIMNQTLSNSNHLSQAQNIAELKAVNDMYFNSIQPLEAALAISPNDPISIELLKNICFRLREEPGIVEKYEKYKEMFDKL